MGGTGYESNLNNGGRYHPATNTWTATTTAGAPSARYLHTAVWTGNEMIVWGGTTSTGEFNTGGRYNPGSNIWVATNTSSAPAARLWHTAIWTGERMIVWGGGADALNPVNFNTGGLYDPDTNMWTPTSTTGAPAPRARHTTVWTGAEMIVWVGVKDSIAAISLMRSIRMGVTTTPSRIYGHPPRWMPEHRVPAANTPPSGRETG